MGAVILAVGTGRLLEHVNIVHNDILLASSTALEEPVEARDSLIFLPAFAGG